MHILHNYYLSVLLFYYCYYIYVYLLIYSFFFQFYTSLNNYYNVLYIYTSVKFTVFHSLQVNEFCKVRILTSFCDDDKNIFARSIDKRRVAGNVL